MSQRSRSRTDGQHKFSQISNPQIQRSSFDRSHGHKLTMDAGNLVPFFVDEALPGDTFNMRVSLFGRIATLIYPIMDNVTLETFFFAVPYRLLWSNWNKFMGEQTNPGDSTDFLIPQLDYAANGAQEDSMSDYFGIPIGNGPHNVSALPFRAYNLIFNEWFRHQDLQDSMVNNIGDGPDSTGIYPIMKRGKRHDYFTSCLPWPQKGDAVQVPLGGSAPLSWTVDPLVASDLSVGGDETPHFNVTGGAADLTFVGTAGQGNSVEFSGNPSVGSDADVTWAKTALTADMNSGTGTADLSQATAATINAIRQAFQIQRLLERDARGGTRYTEIVRSHFGVTSPDQRLQRPEYLGGGSVNLNIREVANTAGITEDPVGDLSAYGTVQGQGHGWTQSFTEHCLVIGLVSLRADLNYQQGLEKMWSRRTKHDFYWPTLAHLGEQAVLNKEIYLQGDDVLNTDPTPTPVDDDVFGYQERYAEYRYKPSRISARFRSSSPVSLDVWHLAQDFATLPVLDSTFIEENPPLDRVIAVTDEPHLLLDCYFTYRCARPMPVFSVPGMIDHF